MVRVNVCWDVPCAYVDTEIYVREITTYCHPRLNTKMLRFLSQDASNAQRIAGTKSAPVAVLAPAVPIYNPLTSKEAENVVLSFIKTEFYTQFSSMEQTQSIVLPSGIVAVMDAT
jgi:hypothetical protein